MKPGDLIKIKSSRSIKSRGKHIRLKIEAQSLYRESYVQTAKFERWKINLQDILIEHLKEDDILLVLPHKFKSDFVQVLYSNQVVGWVERRGFQVIKR